MNDRINIYSIMKRKRPQRTKKSFTVEICTDANIDSANYCYRSAFENLSTTNDTFHNSQRIRDKIDNGITVKTTNKSVLFVAISNDIVIGTAYAEIRPNNTCFCCTMSVLPSFQRKGVATALHNARIEYAIQHGCSKIWLEVYIANIPANIVCQKIGFKLVKSYYNIEDTEHPWNRYEMRL